MSQLDIWRPEYHSSAVLSPCANYRYELWRRWDAGPYCMFIGLNPSTADAAKDDPTIRACIGYAKRWGYAALCMVNLFAWRATEPSDMKAAAEPIGEQNDLTIMTYAADAGTIIAAWGADGFYLGRDKQVIELAGRSLKCLRINGDGSPHHPLYLPADLMPIRFNP